MLTGQSGYDVVFPGSEFVTHQVKAGVYQELTMENIPNLKNMDPAQMELLGHNFFVFCNAETDEINVVYKRKDNTYGLIEPEN